MRNEREGENKAMRLRVFLLLMPAIGMHCGVSYADGGQQLLCEAAGRAAERAAALPANLLVSIGLVESGRSDPATGRIAAWPWTVNVDGAGHYFANEGDAAAFVRLAQSSGARDVDVGCFQISLEDHPDAFGSLDSAFDPHANADFAARFLNQLETRTGSWNVAIANYHSAQPELGFPYQRRVLNAWRGVGDLPPLLDTLNFAKDNSVVILQAPAARLVRVITMDGGADLAMRGLPRVVTP